MKILLVDDERKFVSVVAKRLALRGIDTDCACTGQEALDMTTKNKYDVALLDVKMPGIGGIELRRKLQEIDPKMKFIFITGHGSEEDFAVGSAEASFYLAKPMDIEQIIEKIHEALND